MSMGAGYDKRSARRVAWNGSVVMAVCTCPEDVESSRDPRLCDRCRALRPPLMMCRDGEMVAVTDIDAWLGGATVNVAVHASDSQAAAAAVSAELFRVARRGIGWRA